jgi:hypothetical protein
MSHVLHRIARHKTQKLCFIKCVNDPERIGLGVARNRGPRSWDPGPRLGSTVFRILTNKNRGLEPSPSPTRLIDCCAGTAPTKRRAPRWRLLIFSTSSRSAETATTRSCASRRVHRPQSSRRPCSSSFRPRNCGRDCFATCSASGATSATSIATSHRACRSECRSLTWWRTRGHVSSWFSKISTRTETYSFSPIRT